MTLYADPETRETWRINYGILKLESAQSAFEFWQRRGGVFPGCVLALAHAVEQIDADEELMRQALEALEEHGSSYRHHHDEYERAVNALRERLQ